MTESLKEQLFSGWSVARWLRLGLAAFLLWGALNRHELVPGILGGMLLVQAVFNLSCGIGGCATPSASAKPVSATPPANLSVDFDEVKPRTPEART